MEMIGGEASRERPIDFTPTAKRETNLNQNARLAHPPPLDRGLSFYFPPNISTKNPQYRKNTPERLEIKKYNKFLKRHTVHKEIK